MVFLFTIVNIMIVNTLTKQALEFGSICWGSVNWTLIDVMNQWTLFNNSMWINFIYYRTTNLYTNLAQVASKLFYAFSARFFFKAPSEYLEIELFGNWAGINRFGRKLQGVLACIGLVQISDTQTLNPMEFNGKQIRPPHSAWSSRLPWLRLLSFRILTVINLFAWRIFSQTALKYTYQWYIFSRYQGIKHYFFYFVSLRCTLQFKKSVVSVMPKATLFWHKINTQ